MFYANNAQYIRNNSTVLSPKQVFVGDYWDEFALTNFFIPDHANILVLGLAMGGCIRPLLSSTQNYEMTCIDTNELTNKKCDQNFKKHYPKLKFKIENDDATNFLLKNTLKRDAIWVDIYNSNSYSLEMFSENFWRLIKLSLKETGLAFVNCFGLPMQFSPLSEDGVQKSLVYLLQQQFSYVGFVPHRRNFTIILGSKKPEWADAQPHPALSPMDKVSFRMIGQKAYYSPECTKQSISYKIFDECLHFSFVDKIMLNKWELILADLNSLGIKLSARKELVSLIENSELTQHYLANGISSLKIFIPILAAGQSRIAQLELDWLFEWFFLNHKKLKQENPIEYLLIWLPQMWNLLIGSNRRFLHHSFALQSLLNNRGSAI
jgi:hypothetical protein